MPDSRSNWLHVSHFGPPVFDWNHKRTEPIPLGEIWRIPNQHREKKAKKLPNKSLSRDVLLLGDHAFAPPRRGSAHYWEDQIMKLFASVAVAASLLMTGSVFAGGHAKWTAVEDQSRIAFGSIKKDTVGEVHHFDGVTGTVGEDGKLNLAVDLASVQTNIDIRNERMLEHVFQAGKATAMVSGEIDLDEVKDLKPGDTSIVDFEGVLAFAGVNVDVEAEMLVARLAENRVLVSTADFIMVSTEDLGIDAGINKLMELAKLPGITRVTPVSVRVVFEK